MYQPEWLKTLRKAQTTNGNWLSSWLAFDWVFGKRRNEISKLIREDIWVTDEFLFTRFYVGKKRARTALIDQAPYTKKRTLKHPAVPFILLYLKEYDAKSLVNYPLLIDSETLTANGYIYPWNKPRKNTIIVHTKCPIKGRNFDRTDPETYQLLEYSYLKPQGYIDPALVYYYVKKTNPKMWPHLGRHSVATRAAEDGATEYDISNILDVSPRTASKYVHHGTALTEAWSRKTD